MKKTINYTITNKDDGLMIKAVLSKQLGLSRREISRLKFTDGLRINHELVRVTEIVHEGDEVELTFSENDEKKAQILLVEPDILYEDEDLVVVNKPTGMPTHPSHKHLDDDMGTLLQNYYGKNLTIRSIGRLDKDVSGIVLYAKNQLSAARLSKQRNEGILKKTYIAVVNGEVEEDSGTWTYSIHKKEGSIQKKVDKRGNDCITHYKVLQKNHDHSILEVMIETGRSHQIRAGLAAYGYPIVGDSLYGSKEGCIACALHSHTITFKQPFSNEEIYVEAPLPSYMQEFFD